MTIILDASLSLAWCFEDEHAAVAWDLFDEVMEQGALVPAGWPLEVAQALAASLRRGRLLPEDLPQSVRLVEQLPVEIDLEAPRRALGEILTLIRRVPISAYDAAYVELAQRRGLPLATLDRKLAGAARSLGLVVKGV